jgi:hypothetical protein
LLVLLSIFFWRLQSVLICVTDLPILITLKWYLQSCPSDDRQMWIQIKCESCLIGMTFPRDDRQMWIQIKCESCLIGMPFPRDDRQMWIQIKCESCLIGMTFPRDDRQMWIQIKCDSCLIWMSIINILFSTVYRVEKDRKLHKI